MAHRKTTLMLEEQLIADFKIRAAKAGKSLSSMVSEAMRAYDERQSEPRPTHWELPVLGGGGELAPIDWSSNAAVLEYLEGDLPLEKQR
jgi:hypothetical protein